MSRTFHVVFGCDILQLVNLDSLEEFFKKISMQKTIYICIHPKSNEFGLKEHVHLFYNAKKEYGHQKIQKVTFNIKEREREMHV